VAGAKDKSAVSRRRGATRPGPGRPTRQQAAERNLQLLDRALDLFFENGFERTTMEGIAASVGMAKRTVYALYGDKQTLLKASLHHAINEWIVPVDRLRAVETDDLEETLTAIGQILVDNIMRPEGMRLLRVTNAEAGHMPEISAYSYEQGTAPTLAFLTELFARRLRPPRGKKADSHEAALAFLSLVVGGPANLSAWGLPMTDEAIRKHTGYCVRLFLHGVLSGRAG